MVLLLRHRAKTYEQALKADRNGNERALREARELLHDMITPDMIIELTNLWLSAQKRADGTGSKSHRVGGRQGG